MAVVFPLFMIALRAMRAVLVFNRGQIPDKEVRGISLWGREGRKRTVHYVKPSKCRHYALSTTHHANTMTVPQKFNKWIDKELANTPQTGLAVYPEGVLIGDYSGNLAA